MMTGYNTLMNCNGMKYHAVYTLESCHFISLHQPNVYRSVMRLTVKKKFNGAHDKHNRGRHYASIYQHKHARTHTWMTHWIICPMSVAEANQFIVFRKFYALIFLFLYSFCRFFLMFIVAHFFLTFFLFRLL